MPKILTFLFLLPLLCCSKDQQPEKVAEEFESSINKVVFKYDQSGRHNFRTGISIAKTDAGAFATYNDYTQMEFARANAENIEAELDADEWLNFTKALHKCNVDKWEKKYDGTKGQFYIKWSLNVLSSDKEESGLFSGDNAYPQNWKEFTKVMEDIREKIKSKAQIARQKQAAAPLENRLKTEYQKKFGEPITDFELSMTSIVFNIPDENYISIRRTSTGAIIEDEIHDRDRHWSRGQPFELKLDMEEWLDFIRALRKCKINEWKKEPDSSAVKLWLYKLFNEKTSREWQINIYSSDKSEPVRFSNRDAYLPNWKEFKKIMDSMAVRIKATKKEADDKLKAEYQKKFGEPITDFELSIRSIKADVEDYEIIVFRTETGALAMPRVELNTGEWLDFIRTLRKCIDEWGKNYNKIATSSSKWKLAVFSQHGDKPNAINEYEEAEGGLIFGSDAYPSNWEDFKKLIEDMAIRTSPTARFKNKLKIEYEKRFGEPISDFELSLKEIKYDTYGVVSVSRTETGATAYYFLARKDSKRIDMELTMDEWLDFIRILRKCRVNEWEKGVYHIGNSGMVCRGTSVSFNGDWVYFYLYDEYPPNWNEFKKTMDNMLARIKAEPTRKKAEETKLNAKLKTEYKKRFGESISNFELLKGVSIYNGESNPSSHIFVLRRATGAIAIIRPWNGEKRLELELSTEEWLDFMRALYKIRSKWNKKYGKWKGNWAVEVYFSDEEADIREVGPEYRYEGSGDKGSLYPPDWDELKKLTDDMVAKIEKNGKKEKLVRYL